MKIKVKEAEAEYCINCGALCKHPVHSGCYTFCSQSCYFDFLEHEDIIESKKGEGWARNRITESDARKKVRALQKQGKLDKALREVATAISYVQNALANSSPEVKDNALNSSEKKIVARAVLAQIAEQFGYGLID